MIVNYKLDENLISLALEGNTFVGDEEILLLKDENLIENTAWNNQGFSIEAFLNPEDFEQIQLGIKTLISDKIIEAGSQIDDVFELEKYHLYVDDELHLKVAKLIQTGWNVNQFPIDIERVNRRISEIIGQPVCTKAKHVDMNNFFVRIVRPQNFQDNNPPHRDVWLDRLRDAVNIYTPICGSNDQSALGLIPGSHLLKESEIERTADGAILNGTSYTVPCVISIQGEIPSLIRPNPKENEVMLFSPYLVHGGGYNFNADVTRISLEIRFWKI
jgi:hypothetical protein